MVDGGVIKAVLPVASGETLYVLVGGEGGNSNKRSPVAADSTGGAGGNGRYTRGSENGDNGAAALLTYAKTGTH